jgi:nucleoside phosphorylase
MILVPRGAEYLAVRRACSGSSLAASILAVPAGAASSSALEHASGTNFVIVGLCGALDPALRVGDAVVCDSVQMAEETIAFDPDFTAHVEGLVGGRRGRAVTVDRIVTSRAERAALFERTRAHIVEMEGAHLARRLLALGCSVAMVRIVSDDASYDLPDIARALDAGGSLRPLILIGALMRKPRSALRFISDARRALAVLGATTARLVSH